MRHIFKVLILSVIIGCGGNKFSQPQPQPEILLHESRDIKGHRLHDDDTVWVPSHGKTLYHLIMDNPRGPIDPKYRGHIINATGKVFSDHRRTRTFFLVQSISIAD